jgi:hypothetical protein
LQEDINPCLVDWVRNKYLGHDWVRLGEKVNAIGYSNWIRPRLALSVGSISQSRE